MRRAMDAHKSPSQSNRARTGAEYGENNVELHVLLPISDENENDDMETPLTPDDGETQLTPDCGDVGR